MKLFYNSVEQLVQAAEQAKLNISHVVLAEQAELLMQPMAALTARMEADLEVMCESARQGLAPGLRSASGLSGGAAARVDAFEQKGALYGPAFGRSIAVALAVSEYNAAMGRIVAAPTAGSCGILPGAILPLLESGAVTRRQTVLAMFTAGAFGMVIANKASVAGAQGGCQAECGSASAMAAAALVELRGGTPRQCAHACAIAIKNQLGLVCDPVAGLVEVPCVKRNAAGVANAITAAELALAGVESVIPCDEVIAAMRAVGDALPASLKETAEGGLAATPTGRRLQEEIFGQPAK